MSPQLFVFGGVMFVLGTCGVCGAQRPAAAVTPQKIAAALQKPTRLEFIQTPLTDVVAFLKDRHQIEIQIDQRSLDAVGLTPQVPITANIKDVSLASSLLVMLRQVGLVCVVQRGFLLITTPDGVRRWGGGVPGLTVPKPWGKTGPADAAAKTTQALQTPTTLEFIETPLQDVVDFLQDKHGVPIFLDKRALADVGIGTDTPITQNINGVSLSPTLLFLLGQVGLTCVQQEEFLLITTPREAESWGGPIPAMNKTVGAAAGSAREKIDAALEAATTMEFIETPLEDVVAYWKNLHNIPILIDRRALEDVGIGTDTPISRNLKGVPFRSALLLTLDQLGLACAQQDEFLLITTPAAAKGWGGPLQPNPQESKAATEKIEQALQTPTVLEFIDTPLSDVIEYLKDFHDIPIVIDDRALAAEGVSKSAPVTRNIKQVPLGAALTLVLDELKLAHKVENGVLVITTQKRAGVASRDPAEAAAAPSGAVDATYRTWSDNTGRFTIEAALAGIRGDEVVLKKKDGSTVTVPLSRLSPSDQQWVRRRQ